MGRRTDPRLRQREGPPSRPDDRTTQRIAQLILDLDAALQAEYGADYAFTIAGNGWIIAASNYADGRRLPEVE